MKATLKQWRGLREMSQDELAEAVGVSRISVWKWETGSVEPRSNNMNRLRAALKLKETDHIISPKT